MNVCDGKISLDSIFPSNLDATNSCLVVTHDTANADIRQVYFDSVQTELLKRYLHVLLSNFGYLGECKRYKASIYVDDDVNGALQESSPSELFLDFV